MAVTEFFAGVPVADYRAIPPWYERLMGKAPDFFPQEGEAVWRVTEHAWIYVVADTERAGKALLTVLVDDLDDQVAQLACGGSPSDRSTSSPGPSAGRALRSRGQQDHLRSTPAVGPVF